MSYEEILARMQRKYHELTGVLADDASDIGIRLKVLAGEVSELAGEMKYLQAQVFAQTASDEYLDRHAETRAITRKPALKASGNLVFSREYAAGYDIAIPKGVLCSTRSTPQIHIETTADAVLQSGQTSVSVPAEAVTAGSAANVLSGEICLMITGAQGINTVQNPLAFSGGSDAESDEMLRSRLLTSYRNISNTTNTAFYYDMAMSQNGVISANILPRKRGRGTVDVVIACATPEFEAKTSTELGAKLAHEKEINVSVQVYPAIRDNVNITLHIAVGSDDDFAIASAACKEYVHSYISSLAVGAPLFLAQLGRGILELDGIYNYSISTPLTDILPNAEHILRSGTITVERMTSA